MTLSDEKAHIDDGFVFLGFHIQAKTWGDGRRVVLTIPSKQNLAAVMRKIKKLTWRGTTSLTLAEVLRTVNPVLRGWAAYFRYGASKRTFAYLGWYAWWRLILWIRRKHPHLTWKQIRRRYYGADRIAEEGLVLYNPAKMKAERYRFRGAQISTPYNIDEGDLAGHASARPATTMRASSARSANSWLDPPAHVESRMPGQRARPVRRAGTRKPTPERVHGVSSPTQLVPLDDTGAQLLFRLVSAAYERRALAVASHWPFDQWGRFLPEHTTAVSILDRLLHHAHVVITDGDSYRMRQARSRKGTATNKN